MTDTIIALRWPICGPRGLGTAWPKYPALQHEFVTQLSVY